MNTSIKDTAVHPTHVNLVDGLRGIGALAVVWYHLWLHSWNSFNITQGNFFLRLDVIPEIGYLGVDLLLFITGFGLFYPYAIHIIEKKPLPSIKHFFLNRILRIIPSYYLLLAACVLFFTVETDPFRNNLAWHLITHMTFTHVGFVEASGSLSAVLWTLGTEVQFYILFPVIAWFFRKSIIITSILMIIFAYFFRVYGMESEQLSIENWLRQAPAFIERSYTSRK